MSCILLEQIGAIAKITLSDPATLNAMSEEMQLGLLKMVNETAADPAVRAVVVTGAGRAFCSGGNVKNMPGKIAQSPEVRAELMMQRHQAAIRIQASPKIFIALINGPCFGAGLGLAMACDFRFAAKSAKFGTAFAKIGLSGDFGTSWTLTQLVGTSKARELMLLAEPFDAEKAEQWGLVNDVYDDADLMPKGMAMAERIASGPTVALGYVKQNLSTAASSSLLETMQTEIRNQMHAIRSNDHREAVLAFAEKRPPAYTGT